MYGGLEAVLLLSAIPGRACGVVVRDLCVFELGCCVLAGLPVLDCADGGVSVGCCDKEGMVVAGGLEKRLLDLISRTASVTSRRKEGKADFFRTWYMRPSEPRSIQLEACIGYFPMIHARSGSRAKARRKDKIRRIVANLEKTLPSSRTVSGNSFVGGKVFW